MTFSLEREIRGLFQKYSKVKNYRKNEHYSIFFFLVVLFDWLVGFFVLGGVSWCFGLVFVFFFKDAMLCVVVLWENRALKIHLLHFKKKMCFQFLSKYPDVSEQGQLQDGQQEPTSLKVLLNSVKFKRNWKVQNT